MLDKNLQRLEFDKILANLSNFAITSKGKDLSLSLRPSYVQSEVEHNLEKTNLALELIYKKGLPPIEDFSDIEIYLKNLESNNCISAKALLDIAFVLSISRNLYNYMYDDSSFNLTNYQPLCNIFNSLYLNKNIETKILDSIVDENTIADTASPILNKLRKNRRNLEQEIRTKLSNFIHSYSTSKYLMDNIITIRGDRFVLPIKEEFKDKVPGSILDISSSGSTLYIEPNFIYDLNTQINNIKFEESVEIEKILLQLSSLLFPISKNLRLNTQIIYELDFIFSRAKYSKSIFGIKPIFNKTKNINLINARHPLISPETVVPINFSIGGNYTTLLITGPNTGRQNCDIKNSRFISCYGLLWIVYSS